MKEEHLLGFSARVNCCASMNNADIPLSVWVFTVNRLLRWTGSESHLPNLLSQQTLQTWAWTRSENVVYKLSIGSAGSLEYYFLVAILLHVISSFTLDLLLFCDFSELWGMNACILPLHDWDGKTASWEVELPTRRISVLKALNSRAVFSIAKQKWNSSEPCNVHPSREMNNSHFFLYKGKQRSNKSGGIFSFALVEHKSDVGNWITDFWIPQLICWTIWISLPKSLNFVFTQPFHFSEIISALQPDHR